jgi:LysM repeat protein
VDTANVDRRPRKFRRTGRHTTPSQVEKAAEKAGKAAPAMAIAGVLVAAPQAHAAVKTTPKAATVAEQEVRTTTTAFVRQDQSAIRTYTVRPGDTLSSIAEQYYDNPGDWTWIYAANKAEISNPNDIVAGEQLTIPYSEPAGAASYTPKHAKASVLASSITDLSGTLSCSSLEQLWEAAGGSSSEAFMAAEIAMAESGGQQYALSPTDDYGYWQINASHGLAEATFDPIGNAEAAVAISDDGTDWDPWTTYVTGAYEGQC